MLNSTFLEAPDRKAIDIVILHKDTKCLWLDYTAPKAHHPKCIACVVFTTFSTPPFGAFVSYPCIHKTHKKSAISPELTHEPTAANLHRHGIGTKLQNLTQYIAWIYVRNISLHLCATLASVEFYLKLTFRKYDCDITNLPRCIQNAMLLEDIKDIGDHNKMYPMHLKDYLLTSIEPSPVVVIRKYCKF